MESARRNARSSETEVVQTTPLKRADKAIGMRPLQVRTPSRAATPVKTAIRTNAHFCGRVSPARERIWLAPFSCPVAIRCPFSAIPTCDVLPFTPK